VGSLPAIYRVGDLEIDEVRGEVRRAGEPVALRARPLRLLLYLLRHRDRVISKQELFEHVWPGVAVSDAALASALADLRRALGHDGKAQRLIETRRGRGYRWVAPVEAHPAGPLFAGDFVGRGEVLAELASALDAALAGRGRLVLLTGEAGIGKTRCAEELARIAAVRGVLTHTAWCQENGGTPAYWPWRQILRSVADAGGELPERVARLLSEAHEAPTSAAALEADEARFRLFDDLARALRRAAEQRGLVLLLDDLQWADASSLALLAYVARDLQRARILLVATVRDTEVHHGQPAAETLAELARAEACTRIGLHGLRRADVRILVTHLSGAEPDEAYLDALLARTDGNPFLVREVATASREEEGTAVPPAVADVTGARLRRLSPPCHEALAYAATLGGDFTAERLAAVSGTPEALVAGALDEARRADIIREVAGRAAYRFSHALVREAVEGELPAHARARLHRRVGEALEALYGPDPGDGLAELARHFDAAGDPAKAADYATRAGLRALEIPAREAACSHFAHAIAAFDRLPSPDLRQRCQVLRTWGYACIDESRPELWRPLFREAAELADRLGDAEALADAARGFSAWIPFSIRDEEGVRLLERALSRLGTSDSPSRVLVLARLAHQLEPIEPGPRVDALLDEAEAVARRLGDPWGLMWADCNRSWVMRQRGVSPEAYLAATDRTIALAEKAGEPVTVRELHVGRTHAYLALGDLAGAERTIGIVADAARWSESYRAEVERYRVRRCIDQGRLAEAETRIEALEAHGPGVPPLRESGATAQRYILRREQGRIAEFASTAVETLRAGEGAGPPEVLRAFQTLVLADLGRGAEARAALRSVDPRKLERPSRPLVVTLLAEACVLLADAQEAPRLYELLLPLAPYGADTENGWVTLGSTSRILGHLALLLGRLDDAEHHFEAALAFDTRMEAPLWQGYDRVGLVRTLDARGGWDDRERAFALATEALAWARERELPRLMAHAGAALEALHADRPRRRSRPGAG
jgi:DNA-binding winged helix-turn-helix (wHTH) protein/tetratricopeptide (TPR) repeat protein